MKGRYPSHLSSMPGFSRYNRHAAVRWLEAISGSAWGNSAEILVREFGLVPAVTEGPGVGK
jgi:hypothetical protein